MTRQAVTPTALLCQFALLCLLCLTPCHAEASGPTGPRFTWPSFQRFWDKQASPLVYLTKAEKVENGYLVDFGHSVTFRALMKDRVVTGVEMRFLGGPGNDAGGPQFQRLIYQSITVGTYHWPDDKIDEVRRLFAVLSPQDKEFRYQMTHFKYSYTPATGWSFGFSYTQDPENPSGRASFPEEKK